MQKSIKPILTIAKKELFSFFNTSTGYVLIVPFVLITTFLYFQTAFISNQASLRYFFDILPFTLIFLAPAIAMRTFAQEQKNKTLELIFSHPISETQIVLGKFLGSLAFFAIVLASTALMAITTLVFASPDLGVIISQYLGALFVGGAFLAIGIAAATLTATQVASFLLAAAVSFLLMLIGFEIILLSVPQVISQFVAELAILPHMNSISRGVLDLRDILYFLTIIGAFLTLAIIKLSQRKTVENTAAKLRLQIALLLIIGIGIVLNIFINTYPVRLDLTVNRLYTLSQGTKETLEQLPDVVTITLFTSSNLPGQIQVQARQATDLLKDYVKFSDGQLRFIQRYPDTQNNDEQLAQEAGIRPIQFNTIANNSFAVQAGYFALEIQYGDQREVIPFIQSTEDLEYQITRRIRKMTAEEQQTVALYTQPPSFQQDKSFQVMQTLINTQYDTQTISLDQPDASISAKSVVVYGLTEALTATATAKLENYVNTGGNALLLLDNHQINAQAGSATPLNLGVTGLLDRFGITLNQDLVYDLQLNEVVSLNDGGRLFRLPYPFWIKAIPTQRDSSIIDGIRSVSMAWSSSFDTEVVEGVTITELLTTSPQSGSQEGVYTIAPSQISPESFSQDYEPKIVAISAQKDQSKLVVVGDSEFASDQFMQSSPDNEAFVSNLVDWVAADESILAIPKKSGINPVFTFTSPNQPIIVQWTNILLPPILISIGGIWWLRRRQALSKRSFNPTLV